MRDPEVSKGPDHDDRIPVGSNVERAMGNADPDEMYGAS